MIARVLKFVKLAPAERRLLLGAALALSATRLALLLPFALWRRLARLSAATPQVPAQPQAKAADRIAWAVKTASRVVPGTSGCLVRALAARAMMVRRGIAPELKIGVAKDARGQLRAHAWLEYDRETIAGTTRQPHFVPLAGLHGQV